MRPTLSPVLWLQMVGRGVRPHKDKEDCLLLDFAQNVERFGFVDEITFKDKTKKDESEGVPPIKECPECDAFVPASARFCRECDHEFEIKQEVKIQENAYDRPVLSTQSVIEEWEVTDIYFTKHEKKGKPPSLKIIYYSGLLERVSEWVCFEHEGYARTKAVTWWYENTCPHKRAIYEDPLPSTVQEALDLKHLIIKPAALRVKFEGKYPRIVSRSFEEFDEAAQDHLQQNQSEEDDFEIPW